VTEIIYIGPFSAIKSEGHHFPRGIAVPVPDHLAERLLEKEYFVDSDSPVRDWVDPELAAAELTEEDVDDVEADSDLLDADPFSDLE
jgi:hypothetical protein